MREKKTKESIRSFYERFHQRSRLPWISRKMQQERLRIIGRLIKKCGIVQKNERCLIIGCGSGDDITIWPEAFALDISWNSLLNTKKKVANALLAQGDAQELPFSSDAFDLVICSEVVEHLPKRGSFFSEADRVLKRGGYLIITTPNWRSWYGLARFAAERVTHRPVTADNQPIDTWTTIKQLAREMEPWFQPMIMEGIWYYPPMGKGYLVLPFPFSALLYFAFLPFERLAQRIFPGLGHMIAITAIKR